MALYNRYVLSLALVICITTVVFAIIAISSLGLAFAVYVVECLVLTEFFIHLDPRARRNLSRVNYLLLALMMALVTVKLIEVILGATFLF